MRFFDSHFFLSARRLAAFFVRAVTVCLVAWVIFGIGNTAYADEPSENEKQFENLVKEFKKLIENPREASKRDSWERMEQSFLNLRSANPKAILAAKAYYQSGRCLEELARNTRKSQDAKDAAARFAAVAQTYPKHTWADDALYRKAIVELEVLGDKKLAASTLDDMIRRFPGGDMIPRARELRRSLPGNSTARDTGKKDVSAAENKGRQPDRSDTEKRKDSGEQKTSPAGKTPASGTLLRTTMEAQNAKSTAYVELDRGSAYFYRYVPGDAKKKQPPFFLVEFFGVRPDKKNKPAVAVPKGPVGRIWTRDVSDSERFITRLEFELNQECAVTLKPRADKPVLRIIVEHGSATKAQTRGTGYAGQQSEELKPRGTAAEHAPVPVRTSTTATVGADKREVRDKETARQRAVSANRRLNPTKSKDLAEQLGLTVKTIMLDAGHGGKDPGAMSNGVVEGRLVLKVVRLLGANLKKRGFTVLYTRSGDKFLKLEERTRIANRRRADLFVSVHVNANHDTAVNGLETYYLDVAYTANAKRVAARENAVSEKTISDLQGILTDLLLSSKMHESKQLAGLVLKNICGRLDRSGYKVKNNGVRSAPFYVLMGAKMPSILIEIGYCTNPAEAQLLKNNRYLEFLVDGIAEGIVGYKKALDSYAMNK